MPEVRDHVVAVAMAWRPLYLEIWNRGCSGVCKCQLFSWLSESPGCLHGNVSSNGKG